MQHALELADAVGDGQIRNMFDLERKMARSILQHDLRNSRAFCGLTLTLLERSKRLGRSAQETTGMQNFGVHLSVIVLVEMALYKYSGLETGQGWTNTALKGFMRPL
jgi:hypothetical protein